MKMKKKKYERRRPITFLEFFCMSELFLEPYHRSVRKGAQSVTVDRRVQNETGPCKHSGWREQTDTHNCTQLEHASVFAVYPQNNSFPPSSPRCKLEKRQHSVQPKPPPNSLNQVQPFERQCANMSSYISPEGEQGTATAIRYRRIN